VVQLVNIEIPFGVLLRLAFYVDPVGFYLIVRAVDGFAIAPAVTNFYVFLNGHAAVHTRVP